MVFYINSFKKIPKVVNARNVAGLQSKNFQAFIYALAVLFYAAWF
jgi:hypothetical protein